MIVSSIFEQMGNVNVGIYKSILFNRLDSSCVGKAVF